MNEAFAAVYGAATTSHTSVLIMFSNILNDEVSDTRNDD